MELALYCPNCGYYETEEDIIGRHGDYYTSVSTGSLFGELLGFQFAEWLQGEGGAPSEGEGAGESAAVRIIEAGAHGGDLAATILRWLCQYRPGLFSRLEYWIVEPSSARRRWQERNLAGLGGKVRWVDNLVGLAGSASPELPVPAVLFANELLDAMPQHRFGWDAEARAWFEWGVKCESERFVWTRMRDRGCKVGEHLTGAPLSALHAQLPIQAELLEVLPDGFTIEVSPAATQWWGEAAMAIGSGRLVAVDYGLIADELLVPERKAGTLRSYYRHHPVSDVLANPGLQDITAHVNFTAIQSAGESAGFKTEALLTQAQFLTRIAAKAWKDERSFGNWTPERIRQFQTLTHPEHLGRAFRVLVQERL